VSSLIEKLLPIAADQYGYFSSKQASCLDVTPTNIKNLVKRCSLEVVYDQVYKIDSFPFYENSQLASAIAWTDGFGCLIDETALELWNICDINPRKIHIGVPTNYTKTKEVPKLFVIDHIDTDQLFIWAVQNIPIIMPADAIDRCIDKYVRSDLLLQAIDTACKIGEMTYGREDGLRSKLRNRSRSSTVMGPKG